MKTLKYFLALCGICLGTTLPGWAGDSIQVRVALVQAHLAWGDVDKNLEAFGKRVKECKDCDVIVFPELFTSGCEMKKQPGDSGKVDKKAEVASRYDEILARMKGWARQTGALIMGSTIYCEAGKYYNRLLAVYPDGDYRSYDKHNCFKKGSFSPGTEHLVLTWKQVRFSTYICYDLRFPEWSRNEDTYDVAIYVANWPESRSDDWNRLLVERARENKAYVVAVNCAGTDPTGMMYRGDSGVFTPEGHLQVRSHDYADEVLKTDIKLVR